MNKEKVLKLEIEKLKLQVRLKELELANIIHISQDRNALNIKSNQIKK